MTRSVLRMFVVLAAALYLFGGAGGGDVQAFQCVHVGWDCDNEICGWIPPTAPTNGYHYTVHRCCFVLEDPERHREICYRYTVPSGSCC